MRLSGKVAILSGAARGMGAAQARLFAREDARVLLADCLEADVTALAEDINRENAAEVAIPLKVDVTKFKDWSAAVALAEENWGGIDVLVNNAAIVRTSTIETATEDEWNQVLSVNLTGTWLGMKAVIPAMRRRGGGSIVNISSLSGLVGTPGHAAYHASKGAVRQLAKNGAVEFASKGIRCNTIFPGPILTPMLESLMPDERTHDAIVRSTLFKRLGTPEEIAFAALFLASDEASFVTGAELAVDGGYTAV